MRTGPPERALRQIRTAVAAQLLGGTADRDLLERFLKERDEAAFAALLERHAPMVLGVCRRTLADRHLAEDVLQATFLLLARKAASIRRRDSVGPWLHGAALRLARRAAADQTRAGQGDRRPPPDPPPDPLADLSAREFLTILDAEIDALPEHYRAVLLLCHLEGRTRDEAAALLGWSVGQVRGRLQRGLDLLRRRLLRRGVAPAVALSAALVADPVSSALLPTTIPALSRAAARFAASASDLRGQVADRTLSLTEGALRTMHANKLKFTGAAVLAVALLGAGVGVWLDTRSHADEDPAAPANPNRPVAEGGKPDAEARRTAERQTRANLRKIAEAMHNYEATYGSFPASAIYGPDGTTPLLSWRVALLPYLGETALYKQFRLDQPWDSPHNKKLLARMPAVYRVAALQPKEATATYYQVIVGNGCVFEESRRFGAGGATGPADGGSAPGGIGPLGPGAGARVPSGFPGGSPPRGGEFGAPMPGGVPDGGEEPGSRPGRVPTGLGEGGGPGFRPPRGAGPAGPGAAPGELAPRGLDVISTGVRMGEITDGTSNTLLVVEGDADVPWTKPEDIPYSAAGRVPRLGGLFAHVAHVAFADADVYAIDKKTDEKVLRWMITRAEGQPFDREAVVDPIFTTNLDQLRRENRVLEQELAEAAQELVELKRRQREQSIKQAPDGRDRTELQELRLQQKRLLRERDELRREAERLREQLGLGEPARPPAKRAPTKN